MFFVFLLSLSSLVSSQTTCCIPPISLFAIASDLQAIDLFPGVTTNFTLVNAGEILPTIQMASLITTLSLHSDVIDFPLIFVGNFPDILFNMTLTSSDTSVLLTPEVLPFSTGEVPTKPLRIHVIFECTGDRRETIRVSVNISTSNNLTDEEYCPLFFNFGKQCNEKTMLSEEMRSEFMKLDYVNVSIPVYGGCNRTNTTSPTVETIILLSTLIPLTVVIVVTLLLGIMIWLVFYCKLRKQRNELLQLDAVGLVFQNINGKWEPKQEPHEKEFPLDKLVLKRELGGGAFGKVYEGEAYDTEGVATPVAVKQLHSVEAKDEFFREVNFMSNLQHNKIVKLLGVCSLQEPYAMIFEYMDLGDLCTFLRDAGTLRDEESTDILTESQLVSIALQISQGMSYIASTKLVHRDLAARNCLVATGLIVKIGDFGLSRDIYSSDYYKITTTTLLPLRWMSPESIKYGKFSEATDVYSFGVLLWEIFTFGQQPFAGYTNDEVVNMINKTRYLEIPTNCIVKDVMLDCWQYKANNRPTFNEICSHLTTILHDIDN